MDFTFSPDQLLFQANVKKFFTNEVTPERIREGWASEGGRSPELWHQLAELGLTAITVPEEFGGLGMNEQDFILIAEECGYVALPEPLVNTMLVGVPMLIGLDQSHDGFKADWLPRIAAGEARLAVAEPGNPLLADAHVADLLLLEHAGELHALPREQAKLTAHTSLDPSRRLFQVGWTPSATSRLLDAEQARPLWALAAQRGALGVAAQLLGLSKRMTDLAVDYTYERKQFGRPVGAFQAVKHLMANVAVLNEFAKCPLYHAAGVLAAQLPGSAVAVSHAKLACAEAALLAAKNAMQAHGAMGYTWEVDLHIFMKRAWVLDKDWGDQAEHKARIAKALFAGELTPGAGQTFQGETHH